MLNIGCWILDVDYWMLNIGCRILDVEYWMSNIGCWILDVEYWMLNIGCWISDVEYWMLNIGCWISWFPKRIASNMHNDDCIGTQSFIVGLDSIHYDHIFRRFELLQSYIYIDMYYYYRYHISLVKRYIIMYYYYRYHITLAVIVKLKYVKSYTSTSRLH